MQKLNIAIPQDAVWILNKLNEGGHEAYIVGACIMKIMRSQPIASTVNMPTAAIRTRSPSPKS